MNLYRILILIISAYVLISCGGAEERKAAYLEKARVSYEAGDLDKARVELKNVIQIDPKDNNAFFMLGKIYEKQKDYRKAFSHYLKTEELNPDNLENQAKLGRFYLLLANEPDKAQEKVDYILAKEPANSDGLLLKAAILLRNNKLEEALKLAEDIFSKAPDHIESAAFLATLYIREKNMSKAIDVLDTALKTNKDNVSLNNLLALTLVQNKDYDRAETIYKDFLNRNPDSTASYNNLAAFYSQTGSNDKAEKILLDSITNDESDVDRQLTYIKYIRSTKDNDAAIKEIMALIEKNKGHGKLRTGLAELYIINKDLESAAETLKSAITDFPGEVTEVDSRLALAAIYLNQKNVEQASVVIDEAIKISPNDPKVNFIKAKIAIYNKDYEQAVISLRIVTKETPENIEAFLLLANIYKLQENDDQFNNTLNLAYENNKTSPEALLVLAKFQASRDIEITEKIIDDYNKLKESDYEGLAIKAAILNKKKSYSEAFEIAQKLIDTFSDKPAGYLQAVAKYGDDKDIKSAIALLEKGYLNTKDNRKILILLTTFQVMDKKFDIVENRLKSELKSSPDDSEIKLLLAKVYLANKNNSSAEKMLNDIVSSAPTLEEPYLLLTELFKIGNNPKSEESILLKGKSNVAASLKIPLKLANYYERSDQFVKAIAVYREMYKSNPDNLIVVNNLASMLSDHGNNTDDLELAKSLIVKLEANEQPVFLDTIGWVYYKAGNYQSSIKYLTQLIEKAPDAGLFNYHLGMAHKMAGDKVQAKKYLEKSLESGKDFKEKDLAKEALKDI